MAASFEANHYSALYLRALIVRETGTTYDERQPYFQPRQQYNVLSAGVKTAPEKYAAGC